MKLLCDCHSQGKGDERISPGVGCAWVVVLRLNTNWFALKKSCFDELESLNKWVTWDKMRFPATIWALRSKDKVSIWLIPHVVKGQRIGSCECRAVRRKKKKKKYIVDVLTKASEAESTTRILFMFCSLAPSRWNVLSFAVSCFYVHDGSKNLSFQKVLLKRSTPP